MSLKLPNDKIVYNLPEQVGVNAENIKYLAEAYKDIDSIPGQYAELKADYEDNIKAYFDDTMKPTFAGWTTTFEGWDTTLATYLANMSSAAVGAIAGQNIAPANISSSGNITADSIIENMAGYSFARLSSQYWTPVYVGVVKNGNKLTIVITGTLNRGADGTGNPNIAYINLPASVASKLYPWTGTVLEQKPVYFQKDQFNQTPLQIGATKDGDSIRYQVHGIQGLDASTDYYFRLEQTFLLSDSLAS